MICVCSHIVIDLHFGANMKKVLSICFFYFFCENQHLELLRT